MDRKPEKLVMEMQVWAVYVMEGDVHTGLSLSDDYIVQTFFKNKECAEYVAKVLEDFWEVPHTIMRRIIYVDSIQQDKVYGAVLYFGDDIYVSDDHVFSTTEDVYKYSVIYQYYKDKGFTEVDDPDDGFDSTFDCFAQDYGIYRGDLDSLKEKFNPDICSNSAIFKAPETE